MSGMDFGNHGRPVLEMLTHADVRVCLFEVIDHFDHDVAVWRLVVSEREGDVGCLSGRCRKQARHDADRREEAGHWIFRVSFSPRVQLRPNVTGV